MMNQLNVFKSVSLMLLFSGFLVYGTTNSCDNDSKKKEKTEQMEKGQDEHPSNEHPTNEHPTKKEHPNNEHPAKKDGSDTTKKKEEHPKNEHPK